MLGQIEPVTVVTGPETAVKQITREEEPEGVISQVTGDSSSEPTSPTSRNSIVCSFRAFMWKKAYP